MEELLAAILYGIAEFLAEAIFEFVVEAVLALAVHFFQRVIVKSHAIRPSVAIPGYFLIGAAFGFVSVVFFPHPLIQPSRIHGISLVISPVLAGLFMSLMGTEFRRRGKQSVRIESFGYGFTFALGMAIVRLIFAK
jgi:hypothetical protein